MSVMYVIIICDVGFEKLVIEQLKTINFVKEVKGIMSEYDILVKLESDNPDDLKSIIPSKIRKISNIGTTLTLLVVESKE